MAKSNGRAPILEIRGLKTYFFTEDGVVKAVDGVDLTVARGETLGLVGESGCGKSVSMFSVMRLIGQPGRIVEGEVLFDGRSILDLSDADMQDLRGNRMSMIFQQPLSSLNPVFRIGDQIAEVFEIHRSMSKDEARKQAVNMLKMVGMADPERSAQRFPHEISGGQAQRVMIAMALANEPELLIVVAEMAENVAVMYAGQIVEYSDVRTIFAQPRMPYTQGLLASIPVLGDVRERLAVIPGSVPSLVDLPPGCRFANRCVPRVEHNLTICEQTDPALLPIEEGHDVRCWLYHDHPPSGYKAPLATGRAAEEATRYWGMRGTK